MPAKAILSYDDDHTLLDVFVAFNDTELRAVFDAWAKWRGLEVDHDEFALFLKHEGFGDEDGFAIELTDVSPLTKLNADYQVVSGAEANAALGIHPGKYIWVKLYEHYESLNFDGLHQLASYLDSFGVRGVQTTEDPTTAFSPNIGRFSLFWGDEGAKPSVAPKVTNAEMDVLNEAISALHQ